MWFRSRQRSTIGDLARLDVFHGCTRAQLARIGALCTHLDVEPGRILIRQGAPPRECYVVIDGHAIVSVDDRRVGHVTRNRLFGEVGLIDGRPREATITAASRMSLLVFSQVEFRAVLDSAPQIAATILRTHVAHLRAAEELIAGLEARLDSVRGSLGADGAGAPATRPGLARSSLPPGLAPVLHLGIERGEHHGSDAENSQM
jgi:CRP-like cAMP-binding protein